MAAINVTNWHWASRAGHSRAVSVMRRSHLLTGHVTGSSCTNAKMVAASEAQRHKHCGIMMPENLRCLGPLPEFGEAPM